MRSFLRSKSSTVIASPAALVLIVVAMLGGMMVIQGWKLKRARARL